MASFLGALLLSLAAVLSLASPALGQGRVIVMLGDSLTAGGGLWTELYPGAVIYNLGIPADTTMGIWNRLDEVLEKRPEYIFLQIGINDLGQGRSKEEIGEVSRKIWQELKRELPQTKLYVGSLLPVRESLFTWGLHRLQNSYISQVNFYLANLAEEENLILIDLFHPFLDSQGELAAHLTTDGVHLTAEAYKIWRKVLKPFLP
ncbi:MAG: GDSL-type esterase/lipase family protein [Deltaproteobacteria bacterium]|nr:GDSL-type esterase/lipase family protein [Deltaproteobacteria bacterium]